MTETRNTPDKREAEQAERRRLGACPFCGNDFVTQELEDAMWTVFCGRCEARGPRDDLPEVARDYWNRRATPSPQAEGRVSAVLAYPTDEQMERYRGERRRLWPHDPGMMMLDGFRLLRDPTPQAESGTEAGVWLSEEERALVVGLLEWARTPDETLYDLTAGQLADERRRDVLLARLRTPEGGEKP